MGVTKYLRKPKPIAINGALVVRVCLGCNTEFQSDGDRLCEHCNARNRKPGKFAASRDNINHRRGGIRSQ